MGNDEFLKIAVEEVRRYTKEHLEDPQDFDIYVVWVCKTLQNNKALLSTTLLDGMYFECTYNGDKKELYFDAYQKLENRCIKMEDEPMELQDTVELMNSSDYKDRFKAEYWQAKIRYDKLDDMTVKYEARTLTFIPRCSLDLLKEQKKHLGNYIRTLKIRAEIEGIEL